MEHLESLLSLAANAAILLFEFMGVGIIICSGITGFIKYVRRSPDTRIYLAKGLAMGLEFKLGSEILRTVVVRQWQEIGIVAGIIALRAAPSRSLMPVSPPRLWQAPWPFPSWEGCPGSYASCQQNGIPAPPRAQALNLPYIFQSVPVWPRPAAPPSGT